MAAAAAPAAAGTDAGAGGKGAADPLAATKAALDAQMRRPPFERFAPTYDGEEFQACRFNALVPWGRDQTFTGLTRGTHRGAHTPHGWGVLEHHEGFSQACSMWKDGTPAGPGTWTLASPEAGKEQCGYGTWVDGKRDGFFALVKEGGTYVEEYAAGELKRRIKWRKDKLHVKCTRCHSLFVPSANSAEKLCRFHWNAVDVDGRYPCCGALQAVNPRGCATALHVEPCTSDVASAPVQQPVQSTTPGLSEMLNDLANLSVGVDPEATAKPEA
eukprot:TRINITY_DN484_c0_g1_i1.p1 TRINITY_DN484_c0_g1~~TRINITY_DN484_c0_g1_i1.p1  ORF type:complete len:290 (-),score=49.56 TRINITY_DN484_c0_g1_i1:27-842(-)